MVQGSDTTMMTIAALAGTITRCIATSPQPLSKREGLFSMLKQRVF